MDDDVLYLGTRLAAQVTGIALHIDGCGDKPPHRLSFYRTRSACVNIGRKSTSDVRSMRRENDDNNVVFACQVVSARHAKLVLSDSGQVYIVDLHSRHGTHLARRGDSAPRTLQPEVETLLADGDVLTFGKVVGAGSYHVTPVTVRVELLAGFSPSEPPANRTLISSTPVLEARPRKLSTGRYGLITPSVVESDSPKSSCISVSSDAASSPSDQESDVEDERACVPVVLRDSEGKSSVKIPTFRSFVREMCHTTILHSPAISDVADEILLGFPSSPPSVDVVIQPSPVVTPRPLSKSRSHSPIDVAMSPPSEAQQLDPAVVGAWPSSRPESPRRSSLEVEAAQSEVPLAPELDRQPDPVPVQSPRPQTRIAPPCPTRPIHEMMQCMQVQTPFFLGSGPFGNSIASDFGLPSVPHPPLPPPPPHRMPPFHPLDKLVTERIKSEIKVSFKDVEDRITALQETVSDLKSHQTVTEEDVFDLQSHIEMLEPDSERLLCRITGAERNIATLSTLQGQMTALQNQVTMVRARVDAPELRPAETRMDDIKACADALNSLVSEMKALREDVEKRIEAKMEAIRGARAEALDALKEVVAEAESVRSPKRKREDKEVEEETSEVVAAVEQITCSPPVDMDDMFLPELSVPRAPVSTPDLATSVPVLVNEATVVNVPALEPTRPKKRARTAVYTVAQTAAAMAIGAAATWSALAFS